MSIELHLGPMFASKSALLIRKEAEASDSRETLAYSFTGDVIASRAIEQPLSCTYIKENNILDIAFDALRILTTGRPVSIFMDEIQFAPEGTEHVIAALQAIAIEHDLDIHMFGLDMDYTGKTFPMVQSAMELSDIVHHHFSVCAVCQEPNATMSQRLINGEPAPHDGPLVALDSAHGGENEFTYEPRCHTCYETA